MSVLNVCLSDRRVLVAVDTIGANPDGTRHRIAKMHVMPHLSLIVAARGVLQYRQAICEIIESFCWRFDDVLLNIDRIFQRADMLFAAMAKSNGIDSRQFDGLAQQVLVVGWSDRASAFAGTWRNRFPGSSAFVEQEIAGHIVGPYLPSWGALPNVDLDTLDGQRRVASWQCHHGSRDYPEAGIGGELIIAEMTVGAIQTKATPIEDLHE